MSHAYEAEPAHVPGPVMKTAEDWAAEKQTPAWLFAAARAHHTWPVGRELTEAQFLEALSATRGIRIGMPKKEKK